ncbi:MAG: MBL fold metallo-hydrolase [Coleofasciculus chthonoplastes F3-SA18-01]|uniref:ComEC/Rec2 family competence protein n=1 Tax=Coleofasciculus chthonoplastes TaxID=64178 RepID=UPI0032F23FBB
MKIPSKYQKLAATAITICLVAMITIVLGQGFQDSIPEVVWTMVNVNHAEQQGDAHLIQVKQGKTVLIDAGYLQPAEQQLVPFLQSHKINHLDLVFVSHAHRDHYQGITAIINAGITLKEVYFNIPDKTICDQEIPWGCNYQEVLTYQKMLKERQVEVKSAQAGQAFDLGHDTVLKILYAFNGIQTPVGTTDINDMSLIMRLEHGQHKHLFTGDLNRAIGGYLADHPQEIAADVLKMPHHGTEGVAPNQFFEQVGAKYALVPSPSGL